MFTTLHAAGKSSRLAQSQSLSVVEIDFGGGGLGSRRPTTAFTERRISWLSLAGL